MSHFVVYILQFQEIIVYKIPPGGEGVYSQPKVYTVPELLTGPGLNPILIPDECTTFIFTSIAT